MKKILFFIPNLMHGGAEKVLVNLVNNLDRTKYDITIQTLFDVGVNKKYLNKNIKYKYFLKKIFKGNSIILKLFSPEFLYKKIIKDRYDIVVSYLEGPAARIVSGCPYEDSKMISWIHIELNDESLFSRGFRNFEEAKNCYERYDKIVCVSNTVKEIFLDVSGIKEDNVDVLYNTNETEEILEKSKEDVDDIELSKDTINICSVGKVIEKKGYYRLAQVHKKLIDEGLNHNIYIIGIGDDEQRIRKYLKENNLEHSYKLIGFRENPYKYVAKCDLFVCSSYREGFSTAVTESLIVGTPVISTLCSGAYELLGYNNEYGIVTENSEAGMYNAMKSVLLNTQIIKEYKVKCKERAILFSKKNTVLQVEKLLDCL